MTEKTEKEIPEDVFQRDHGGKKIADAILRAEVGTPRQNVMRFLVWPACVAAVILAGLWLTILRFGPSRVEAWPFEIMLAAVMIIAVSAFLLIDCFTGRR